VHEENMTKNNIHCCGIKLSVINAFKNLKSKIQEKNEERRNQWDKAFFFRLASERLSNRGRILDLGCGRGYFLQISDDNAFGIDGNIKNLKEAQEHCTKVVQGDILELPFSEATFDGIHCSHVIEHFDPHSAYELLYEMNRVLKVGGILIISSPLLWSGFFRDFTHVKPYYPESIMHYYGEHRIQLTKDNLDCFYEIQEIKWRYNKVPLRPILLPKGSIINTLLLLFVEWLNKVGFGKYERSAYTMVLQKLR